MSVYVVAELSGNHNGSIDNAKRLIAAAKESGADAIKLQTYTADTLTIKSDLPWFRIGSGPWMGKTYHDLYQEAHTPWSWHPELFRFAESLEIDIFSTPFDATAVDFLEDLGCKQYKISSFDITDLGLIAYVASKNKPIIMSTGLAELWEVQSAMQHTGSCLVTLLHCISEYPADERRMNLRRIDTLKSFAPRVGLSDHSKGHLAAVMAVAMNATIIERHIKLDDYSVGPDAAFSTSVEDFKLLVNYVRNAYSAMYDPAPSFENITYRKSLFAARDIPSGAALTNEDVRVCRPNIGLQPKDLPRILGQRARACIGRGHPLTFELFD